MHYAQQQLADICDGDHRACIKFYDFLQTVHNLEVTRDLQIGLVKSLDELSENVGLIEQAMNGVLFKAEKQKKIAAI